MESTPGPVNAIGYIRVSDPKQVTEGNSLATQERQIREYCALHGYTLVDIYIEEGQSAKTGNRTKLRELLKDVKRKHQFIHVLVVPRIDRWARYVADYWALKNSVTKLGIRFESLAEKIEETPAGRFSQTVFAGAAQYDNEVRMERCKDGMRTAVMEGRWVWKAPPGYQNVRIKAAGKKRGIGNIVPKEPQATYMREVFSRVTDGKSVREVQRYLHDQGIKLSYSNMYYLLRNPLYCGVIRMFGGEYRAAKPFVALISEEQFAYVQELIKGNRNQPTVYNRNHPDFPLRGTLFCAECGRFMTACWSHGHTTRLPYYRCMTCSRFNKRQETVDLKFAAELAKFKPNPEAMDRLKAKAKALYESVTADARKAVSGLTKRIAEATELRGALALKVASGVVPDDVGKEQIDKLSANIGKLQVELKRNQLGTDQLSAALEFADSFFTNLPITWKTAEVREQKKLQSAFFPTGIAINRDYVFRTSDYPLLEQVKEVITNSNSGMVDQSSEFPNDVSRFIVRLKDEFDISPSTLRESETLGKRDEAV